MKGATKPQIASFLLGSLMVIGGILVLILSNGLFRDWIIIGYGVRALGPVHGMGIAIIAIGCVLMAIGGIPMLKTRRRQQQQQRRAKLSAQTRSRVLTDYAQDSENPEFTRKRLEQLSAETPQLEGLVTKCLKQMEMMDKLQAKQDALIEANDARYLKDTVMVLNNVERRLCRNFRSVINLCIAAESVERLDATKIERKLDDNRKKLDDAKELLKASADWINQYDSDADSDRSEVENWIAVIRDSLKED